MINFYTEDTNFNYKCKNHTRAWLKDVAEHESRTVRNINIIFCSDSYLLDINRKYLKHDYYTDIITFDYCESNLLSGDLFISVDTVKSNSEYYNTDFVTEMHRVIVHGLLHLIGYDDHSENDMTIMRDKENEYLSLRPSQLYD